MDSLPSDLVTEARYKITELCRNISAVGQASTSAIVPESASAAAPLRVTTNASDTSQGHCNFLDFCDLQFSWFWKYELLRYVIRMHKLK
jgi:hypothetical protein